MTAECAWTVDNVDVAFVTPDGAVHGIGPGEAVATCTWNAFDDTSDLSVGPVGPARAGDVVINELLADPAVGADPNNDGTSDATEDEFVELVNAAGYTVDLEGVTLWDTQQSIARHTFGANSTLKPGEAVVIFGGGEPNLKEDRCNAFPAYNEDNSLKYGLALNNDGDTLTVRDVDGDDIGSVTYDGSIEDASVVLNPEIDGASYTHHAYVTGSMGPSSPCTLATSEAFPTVSDRLAP